MADIVKYESLENKLIKIDKELVLLDKDVAQLYDIKPTRLREQVKRNIEKFPNTYAYQISNEVFDLLVSQNAIPSKKSFGGHNPWVFTEKGLYMVATILKTNTATQATFCIIETFAKLKELSRNISVITNSNNKRELNTLVKRSSEIFEDIIDIDIQQNHNDGEIIETETKFEFNLGFFKTSRTTKRKKD